MKATKKSMFITTIVMILLLAVSLSTATYAWFSTNNVVTVSETTVTAAQSQNASIGIGWSVGAASNPDNSQSITFDKMTTAIQPMMPVFNPSAGARVDAYVLTTDSSQTSVANFENPFGAKATVAKAKVIGLDNDEMAYVLTKSVSITDTNYDFTGDVIAYNRIYKIRDGYSAGIAVSSVKVKFTTGELENFDASTGYDAFSELEVVVSSPITGQITASDAVSILSLTEAPSAGDILYNIAATLKPKFQAVHYKASAPSGTITDDDNGMYLLASVGVHEAYAMSNVTAPDFYGFDGIKLNITPSAVADQYILLAQTATTDSPAAELSNFVGEFNTAYINSGRFDKETYDATVTPIVAKEPEATNTIFYVRNNGGPDMNVSIAADISSDGIRLGIFKVTIVGDTVTSRTYVGTLGNGGAPTSYGKIVPGALASNIGKYSSVNSLPLTTLSSYANIALEVVVWYDGAWLDASHGGEEGLFTINITAEK
ncbi:MAG: hypothetical protein LBU04_05150 [Christensenellaceae bacterium]|jgi:hypothetical protein|nr:hypothetical protein [Christensenellaceae bacterium]